MENVHSPLRLFDILRGTSFLLLLYYPDPMQREEVTSLEDLAATLRSTYSSVIKVSAILNAETAAPSTLGATVLRDMDGAFAAAYRALSGAAYLVRPDGYICYHVQPVTKNGILLYLNGFLTPESHLLPLVDHAEQVARC